MRWFLERASRVSRWKLVLAGAVVLGAVGWSAFWAYTAWNEAGAEVQRVRWGNVTITIPADSHIYYARLSWAPQALARGVTGQVLELGTGGDGSLIIVDATTGEVVHDDVLPAERAAFDAVLGTLEVATTDAAAEPGAPWPYGSTLPNTARQRFANITYVQPDPASGISVDTGGSDYFGPRPPGSNVDVRVFNGRSQMHINGAGEVSVTAGGTFALAEFVQAQPDMFEGIHPNDRQAFQRFAQAVEVGPPLTPPASNDGP